MLPFRPQLITSCSDWLEFPAATNLGPTHSCWSDGISGNCGFDGIFGFRQLCVRVMLQSESPVLGEGWNK